VRRRVTRRRVSVLGLWPTVIVAAMLGLTVCPALGAETGRPGSRTAGAAPEVVPSGSVTGRVTSASGRAAIEHVSICATTQVGDNSSSTCTSSESNGEYKIADLPNGSYTVEFSPGYPCIGCERQNYITQYYRDARTSSEAEPVLVTAGDATSGIDARMVEGGRITGIVTTADGGAALASIEVCALARSGETKGHCAVTSSRGEYALAGLATGSYVIPVQTAFLHQFYEGGTRLEEASPVAVTAGATTSGVDAQLVEGGQIAGRVTNALGGAGIEGIDVCALEAGDGDGGNCVSTNSYGAYSVPTLSSGSYHVEFFASQTCSSICPRQDYVAQAYDGKSSRTEAEAVPVTAGTTTPDIDAQMVEGGSITGRVTSASEGAAVAGIEVCVIGGGGGFGANCAATNSDGEYTVQALTEGAYAVEFSSSEGYACEPDCTHGYATQYYSGESSPADAQPVPVSLGSVTSGIDAQMLLESDGTVTGPESGPLAGTGGLTPWPVVPVEFLPVSAKASGIFSLDGSTVTVQSRGTATVKMSCAGTATCAGRLTLTANIADHLGENRHTRTQTLASAAFSIQAGKTAPCKLELNRTGRGLLSAAHGRLVATLTVFETSPTPADKTLTKRVQLTQEQAKARKK
jgi:hypothetical protein